MSGKSEENVRKKRGKCQGKIRKMSEKSEENVRVK